NPYLDPLFDSAVLPDLKGRLAFTTDSYVVHPIFFPGGDIGKLAVCGTINDLAMAGAMPLYLTCGYILEEGLPLCDLERIVSSMAETAAQSGVMMVAGDTKVVPRGSADRIFINTAGIGLIPDEIDLKPNNVRPGVSIIFSGNMGDHGMAILCQREGLEFDTPLTSDCTPLHKIVQVILARYRSVRVMRDPTRGGLATTLVELAEASGLGFELDETLVPVNESVRAACEILGLDPFYLPNEGKFVLIADAGEADAIVAAIQKHPVAKLARIIGRIVESHPRKVILKTAIGSKRVLDMSSVAQLPRIC
ncbi:MAG: hydrogenase expression/formation protein HypE, partial [Syntrophorhabdus sp.]